MPADEIMRKFKAGTLRSGSGAIVTNPAQARAIAASYGRKEHSTVADTTAQKKRLKRGAAQTKGIVNVNSRKLYLRVDDERRPAPPANERDAIARRRREKGY